MLSITPLFLFIFLFSATLSAAVPDLSALESAARQKQLWNDPEWLRLGHYKKRLFGGYSSEVVGSAFFLASEGSSNPEAELLATVAAINSTEPRPYPALYGGPDKVEKQIPRCQFPARYRWLQKKLGIDSGSLPTIECANLDKYRKSLSARSVSIVFSSFYLNNPSSAFGHSFFRISKTALGDPGQERYELLDHGVNYAAEANTDNAFLYGFLGLAGGFRGTYSNVPYYYKVREYNDFESRDLWSYDLNLTDDEVAMLVDHIWELGSTYFRYYYFTQNCSYQILTALEAAAPRFDITSKLPPWVIPSDTIKQLMKTPGLVAGFHYRPSARSHFAARLEKLSPEETAALQEMIAHPEQELSLPKTLSVESRVRVLDAALDYIDSKYAGNLAKEGNEASHWKQTLLVGRATAGVRSEPVNVEYAERDLPHQAHDSARFGIGPGFEQKTGSFYQGEFRFVLHDQLDPSSGYPQYSQMELGNLKMRYLGLQKQVEFEELAIFRVRSLSPLSVFNKEQSWRGELSVTRIRDGNCDRCVATQFQVGTGYAIHPIRAYSSLSLFALAEAEGAWSPEFDASNVRVGAGPAGGILWNADLFATLLQARYRYEAFSLIANTYKGEGEMRFKPSRAFSFGLRGSLEREAWQTSAVGFLYL